MTKVLIFIDWFAPGYKAGGPITSNVNIVDHLSDDFEFYVVTSSFDYHAKFPYDNVVENEWTYWHRAKVMYVNPDTLSLRTLKKIVKEVSCDVWYINGVYSLYYSVYPLILAKCINPHKVIISARGMLSPHALAVKPLAKKIFLRLAKTCNLYKDVTFHATNNEEKQYIHLAISPEANVQVAPNLPRKMPIQSTGCNKHNGEVRLVSFARISAEKNTLFALKALLKCKESVVYHIYGQINSESYWQECLTVIKMLPSNVKVEYKGSVNPENMPQIYRDYHVMYLPSTGENYGHAILESFMNACPVLISDKTPWRNLEKSNVGWDLPLDESCFTQMIDKLAIMDNDTFMRMRLSVNTFIQNYLSTNETKNSYIKIFSV